MTSSPRRTFVGAWAPLIELGWVRQLVVHGSVYSAGLFIQMVGSFVGVAVLTRLLEPGAYGSAVTALLIGQVLVAPASAGVPAAAGRIWFEPGGHQHARRLLFVVPLTAGAVCVLADVTGGVWAPAITGDDMDATLRLGVWSAFPLACFAATQSIVLSQQRPAVYGSLAALSTIGGQAIGIALVAAGGGAAGYLLGIVVGAVFAAAASAAVAGVSPSLPDWSLLRLAAPIGMPTIPHLLALQVISGGDRAVIARYAGLAEVGRYQVAYAVGSLGLAAFGAFTQALAPMVQDAEDETRWPLLASMAKLIHRLAAVVVGTIALAAPVGLAIVAPASYNRGALVPVAATVALAAMGYVGYASAVQVLFQLRRPRILAIVTPAVAAGNILANIAVVPRLGIVGAALITVATYAVQALAVWLHSRSMSDVPWSYRNAGATWAIATSAVTASALLPTSSLWIGLRMMAAVIGIAAAACLFVRLADASRRGAVV